MSKEALKHCLYDYVQSVTTKSKGGLYKCPICNSGEGKNGTGAFSLYSNNTQWQCFSCGNSGDIFDLIGKLENLATPAEQMKRAGEIFSMQEVNQNYNRTEQKQPTEQKEQADYTNYYKQSHKNVENTTYWQSRGITQDTIDKFMLGYDHTTQRAIIPIAKGFYKARAIDSSVSPKYWIPAGSKATPFNVKALWAAATPVYVTEGEINALSIIEAGGQAVAMGNTQMVRSFLKILKDKAPTQPLIIALDNDEPGQKATAELEAGLKEQGISFYRFNPAGSYNDTNEALVADRVTFIKAVKMGESMPTQEEDKEKQAYLKTATVNYLQSFLNGIAESVNTAYISTGFDSLDKALEGGLYEGLYVVGAVSSLGKTTFTLQIADQIARQGYDVLIYSLEMARTELIAKSISRETLQIALNNNYDIKNAKSTRGITTGARYAKYNQQEQELIQSAVNAYGNYAKNLYIQEGIGDIGVEEIKKTIQQHIAFTGKKPVVLIDYMQILAPSNERLSDKQNMDKAVLELKRITRDFKITIIGISSFNRDSYSQPVSMSSYKESGAIEYTSDVVIGLQYKGMDYQEGEKDKDREIRIRQLIKNNEQIGKQGGGIDIQLKILKNRNGSKGDTQFKFYPMFNYFLEE